MTFEQQWLEYDYNPFILFSTDGKVINLNSEAQFLLGSVSTNEIFELATSYANVTFGFKTTFLDLEFKDYKFFAFTVGYEDEEKIGIKLYRVPTNNIATIKPKGELNNIYTLIDLCISTNSISSKIEFIKDFDPTIPEIVIDSNSFIKLINKIYSSFLSAKTIKTKIFYKIGEHIIYEGKKYGIFSIVISSDRLDSSKIDSIKYFAKQNNYSLCIKENRFTLNIPMITS